MAVPSHGFREVLEQAAPHIRPWVPVVSLTKGLEASTDCRMTEIIQAADEMGFWGAATPEHHFWSEGYLAGKN